VLYSLRLTLRTGVFVDQRQRKASAQLNIYGFHSDGWIKDRNSATLDNDQFELQIGCRQNSWKGRRREAGKIARLIVKPGLPLGQIRQRIRIALDLPGDPVVEVPIEGNVTGDISMVGPRNWDDERGVLSLGEVDQRTGATSKGMFLLLTTASVSRARHSASSCDSVDGRSR
jgi:hypothetical protein